MKIFNENAEKVDKDLQNTDVQAEDSERIRQKFEHLMGDDELPERYDKLQNADMQEMAVRAEEKLEELFTPENDCELVDMEMKIEETPDTPHDVYEKDDTGVDYKRNGELIPDMEYTIRDCTYHTDGKGRIISVDTGNLEIDEDTKRNLAEQRESGGENRREGDQGGHLIARMFGGSGGIENLVPMRGTINQGDYKKMELEMKNALEEGKDARLHVDLTYKDESSRPTEICANYTIEGIRTEVRFDNEKDSTRLLKAAEGLIQNEQYEMLTSEIEEMKTDSGAVSITSVKAEYSTSDRLNRVIVGILDEQTGEKSYRVFD